MRMISINLENALATSKLNPFNWHRKAVTIISDLLSMLLFVLFFSMTVTETIPISRYLAQFTTHEEIMKELRCLQVATYREASPYNEEDHEAIIDNIFNRTLAGFNPALASNYGGTTICGVTKKSAKVAPKRIVFQYTSMGLKKVPAEVTEAKAFTRRVTSQRFSPFLHGNMPEDHLETTHYHATYVRPPWSILDVEQCKKRYLGLFGAHHHYAVIRLEDRAACFAANKQQEQIAQVDANNGKFRKANRQHVVTYTAFEPREGAKLPVPADRPMTLDQVLAYTN